jgi:hypothetical protein
MAAILIPKLKALEANPEIVKNRDFLSHDSSDVKEISNLAETHLITAFGECNWDEIRWLCDAGYRVFALEQDRFGWVVGAIQTKKGIITYG